MRLISAKDSEEAGILAANILAEQIRSKPDSVLGLATGGTPLGVYKTLVSLYRSGSLDFANIRSVNLDEYAGLAADHPQSYAHYMHSNLFSNVNIHPSNVHIPAGIATDPTEECRRYDELIADLGGIDLQLVGIGHNGHIGFNEPSDHFTKGTHCVDLTQSTIYANARYFENTSDVPTQAYTVGVETIFRARKILMVVIGKDKASILKKALTGPVTPSVPASILQLHPDFTIVADADALTELNSRKLS